MNTNDTNTRAKLAMNIKGITPSLFEAGKVKIGRKGREIPKKDGSGTFQLPEKLDSFLITMTQRGKDNNFLIDDALMKILPKDPDGKIRRIPITLLYDDMSLNFQSCLACYAGTIRACSGDGEIANQAITKKTDDRKTIVTGYKQVQCPCPRLDFGYKEGAPCKMTGRLQFLIRGAEKIGGVHIYRTAGRNSVIAITSSLALVQRLTGGYLAGIPLELVVAPKHVTDPNGNPQTVYLVAVEYLGSVQTLQDQTHKFLLANEQHRLQIRRVEDEARALLTAQPAPFAEDLDEDPEGDEFFPNSGNGSAPTDFVETKPAAPAPATIAPQSIDDAITDAAQTAPTVSAEQNASTRARGKKGQEQKPQPEAVTVVEPVHQAEKSAPVAKPEPVQPVSEPVQPEQAPVVDDDPF